MPGPYELYFVRHGLAEERGDAWPDDTKRPLTEEGMARLRKAVRGLSRIGVAIDVVLTSPLVRARQTAEIVARHLGLEVRLDERLAGAFDATMVDAILADLGDPTRLVLVGHDPVFSELLGFLAGTDRATMKKGAFARVDVKGPMTSGDGALRWLVPPDLLESRRG